MSQYVDTNTKAFTAGAAIDQYLRVKISSGVLVVATAADQALGTMEVESFASGDVVSVRLSSAAGSRKMVASGAITAGNLVYAAASGKVASSGTVVEGIGLETSTTDGDIIEVMSVSGGGLSGNQTSAQVARVRTTTANVNAGATLLPAVPGFKYRLQDLALIAIGGNAATATGVLVRGTQSSSVVSLLDAKVAGLTRSNYLRAGTATNGVILADGASFVANDVNTAITIIKDGSDLATATHIDALLTYVLEAA
jgi:hypothetical protein